MSRQIFVIIAVLFVVCLFVEQIHSAPHHNKKHAACTLRLFKTLNVLCNHEGHLEILRATASRCCSENCDLTEMITSCTDKPEKEETF